MRYSSILPSAACHGHCGVKDGSDHLHLGGAMLFSVFDLLNTVDLLVRTVRTLWSRTATKPVAVAVS